MPDTLTYYALPTSRVAHGSRDCPSLNLHEQRRRAVEQRTVPEDILDHPSVRMSTCRRCGWGLSNDIQQEQRRRRDQREGA